MKIHLLVSEEMRPVPDNVKVIENYGEVMLVSDFPEMYNKGDHMIVEAEEDAMRAWLGPFNGVWVGDGPPILQQFQVMHVTTP